MPLPHNFLKRVLFGWRRFPPSRNALYQHRRVGRFIRAGAAGIVGGMLIGRSGGMASLKRRRSNTVGRSRRTRRRPVLRRRFFRRVRADRVVSAQAGNIVSTRYRTRFLRRTRYQAALLRDTLFQAHYRSLLTTSFTQTTPVGVNAATKTGLISLLPVSPNPFWTVAGGALPIDSGKAVPTFDTSTIVIRGGRSEVTVGVPGLDAIKLRVYKVWTKPDSNPEHATFNALVSVPTLWDPSHYVDFGQHFKLLSSHEYVLLPGSRPLSLINTIRPQAIDLNAFNLFEKHVCYVFTLQQLTDSDVLPASVIFTVSNSLSFTGDAI